MSSYTYHNDFQFYLPFHAVGDIKMSLVDFLTILAAVTEQMIKGYQQDFGLREIFGEPSLILRVFNINIRHPICPHLTEPFQTPVSAMPALLTPALGSE